MKDFKTQSSQKSSGKSNAGFYKRRRGILEHLESGRISLLDLAVHDFLNLKANLVVGNGSSLPPGVCMTSATAIHAMCPSQISERAIQRSLEHLEEIRWIKRWNVRGKRGNYPVLVCRASVHDLSGNEYRVNGEATTDWRNPVLEPVGDPSALSSEADAKLSGDREVRTEKKEGAEGAAAATAAAPPVREKPKTERNPEAWEAIGIEPCGPLEFIRTWESIYRDRLDDELLSVTMERVIQRCRGRRIPVVRKVFEAKRAVERREADEIATYAANAIPELEAEPWAR